MEIGEGAGGSRTCSARDGNPEDDCRPKGALLFSLLYSGLTRSRSQPSPRVLTPTTVFPIYHNPIPTNHSDQTESVYLQTLHRSPEERLGGRGIDDRRR